MDKNAKYDVALEIISRDIAKALNESDKKRADELLEKKEKIYLGDWDTINEVLGEERDMDEGR